MDYNKIQNKLDQISGEDKIIGIKKLNDEVLAQAVGGLDEQIKKLASIFCFSAAVPVALLYLKDLIYNNVYSSNYINAKYYSSTYAIPILNELMQNGEITSYSLSMTLWGYDEL